MAERLSGLDEQTQQHKQAVDTYIQTAIEVIKVSGEDGFQNAAKNGGVPTLVALQEDLEKRFPEP